MILAFSGDPFLASRGARRALKARGFHAENITELAEGLNADELSQLAAQSGLFGQVALLLDFDTAFRGQEGVKPRNAVLKALETVPADTVVVVLDLNASASRTKAYKALGEHHAFPTPRFNALSHWIRQELEHEKLQFNRDVPDVLADLFGEDLPSLAAEIQKLAVLEETLSADRVRFIANRPASRDAFDLIEQTADGDSQKALRTCRSLLAQGEAPARVLGALSWQYNLVARCVAMREGRARVDASLVAQTLKIRPFVAQKALAIAQKLDETRLETVLSFILDADVAVKSGKDEQWALESLALQLANIFKEQTVYAA